MENGHETIMEKRGALHPLMDPFKLDANKDIVPDYHTDMCPVALDKLSKVVYIGMDPNENVNDLDEKVKSIKAALSTGRRF